MSEKLRAMTIFQVILASVEYKAIILDCLVVTEKPHYHRAVMEG